MERYPVPASRPEANNVSRLRSTRGFRSVHVKIRSTQLPSGICSLSFETVRQVWENKDSASLPKRLSISERGVATELPISFSNFCLQEDLRGLPEFDFIN